MNPNSVTESSVNNLISEFRIDVEIASVKPFGSGHINDTYRIINKDPNGHDYLLQRVNHRVFKDVPLLMNNLVSVTDHLRKKLVALPVATLEREVLTIIQTKSGLPYYKDAGGNYWRVFYFLKGTKS